MKNPIISIITPFLNADEFIDETAKSVINQTMQDFEWIIVDDGSNKKAKQKLRQIQELDERIQVISKSKESEGPAQARDFGIENSSKSSKYIVFLDADDLYDKTFLECCFWILETHPEASWTYTDSANFGERNFLWRKWYNVKWELQENILIVSSCIRKQDLIEVGGFGLKEKRIYEDWYLWIKLIKAGKYPIRMNSLLTYYRQKNGMSELQASNINNKKNAMRIIKEAKRDIALYKDGIQFPKYDYNWQTIAHYNDFNFKTNDKPKSVNVLMIIPWMVTGGADRFNLNLIKRLNKFNFTVITTLPSKNEWRKEFEKYATVYDLTTFLDMKDWTQFIEYIIKTRHINLIFISNSEFGYRILPSLKAYYPEIPIVDFVHMEEWYWKNGGYARISSLNQKFIDKTFTCNENTRNVFINNFKRNEKEIKTIYIGVDIKQFNPNNYNKNAIAKKLKIENKKVISYICRITEQKRPFLFLEVIKTLASRRDDFIVLVVGDGPMLEELKNKAKKEKIEKFIMFLGNTEQTQKIYAVSDVTVNTSIKEGIALTSYESLAMGVPVVSSNVGGQTELINDNVGKTVICMQKETEIMNYNYDYNEIEKYVNALNEVLDNLNFYKLNCRKHIIENFTEDKMAEEIEKELISICENPNVEKFLNGKGIAQNKELLDELISTYFESSKGDYDYLCTKFNENNVHKNENYGKRDNYYENTIEYKIKHPIVVILRKIGMYEKLKYIFGK